LILALRALKKKDHDSPTAHDIVRLVMGTAKRISMMEEEGKEIYERLLDLRLFRECMLFLSKCMDVTEIHCKHLAERSKGFSFDFPLALVFSIGCGLDLTREQAEFICIVDKEKMDKMQSKIDMATKLVREPLRSAGDPGSETQNANDGKSVAIASSSSSSSSSSAGKMQKKKELRKEKGDKKNGANEAAEKKENGESSGKGSPKNVSKTFCTAVARFFTENLVEDENVTAMPMARICRLYKTWAEGVDKAKYAEKNDGLRVPLAVSDRTMRVALSSLPLQWEMHGTEARRRFHFRLSSEPKGSPPEDGASSKLSTAGKRKKVGGSGKGTVSAAKKQKTGPAKKSKEERSDEDDDDDGSISLGPSEDENLSEEGEDSEECSWIVSTDTGNGNAVTVQLTAGEEEAEEEEDAQFTDEDESSNSGSGSGSGSGSSGSGSGSGSSGSGSGSSGSSSDDSDSSGSSSDDSDSSDDASDGEVAGSKKETGASGAVEEGCEKEENEEKKEENVGKESDK